MNGLAFGGGDQIKQAEVSVIFSTVTLTGAATFYNKNTLINSYMFDNETCIVMCNIATVYAVIFEGRKFRGFHCKLAEHKILILEKQC